MLAKGVRRLLDGLAILTIFAAKARQYGSLSLRFAALLGRTAAL